MSTSTIPNPRRCTQCAAVIEAEHRFCAQCGVRLVETSVSDPWIGMGLPGGYVIVEAIGDGGMGRVYRAEHSAVGRTVAVKIIHGHLVTDEAIAARFITEARAASRLNHPNSLSVIGFGRADNGQFYLVMEYLRGRDLARLVAEEGLMSFRRIVDILRQLLDALSEAHQMGIIHRDVKPENVIIERLRTGGDFVKVVDFGLAKILGTSQLTPITGEGIVCGTPEFLAPELCRGEPCDARTDLYAVGVILFFLLTGQLPFEAETATRVLLMHLNTPPPDPREMAPDRAIPPLLAQVAIRALAKAPAERFQTAEQFAGALLDALQDAELGTGRWSLTAAGLAVLCIKCKAPVPSGQKFCGECGTRASSPSLRLPRAAQKSSRSELDVPSSRPSDLDLLPLPLLERDEDVAWLFERLVQQGGDLAAARIVGEPGAGKTRLLQEVASTPGIGALHTVRADPWGIGPSYSGMRATICELAGLPDDGGSMSQWPAIPPEAAAALQSVFGRSHASGFTAASSRMRRLALAQALRWAMQRACDRTHGRRVVLAIDDLDHIDSASRQAIADVLYAPPPTPMLVVATHAPGFDPRWPPKFPARVLFGLSVAETERALTGSVASGLLHQLGLQAFSPMFVEQLVRFAVEGGGLPPRRLGDLIATRIARLASEQRRVLQAISILGAVGTNEQIAVLVGTGVNVDQAVGQLLRAEWIAQTPKWLCVAHPLVREIAEATIPAEVRKQMNGAAAAVTSQLELPIEVRARFQMEAGKVFEALLLLDKVGAQALDRDDTTGAIEAYAQAVAFARSQASSADLEDANRAVVMFSRKLGETLCVAGEVGEAAEVLRGALLLTQLDEERARVLGALAQAHQHLQHPEQAQGFLRAAIDVARRVGAVDLVRAFQDRARDAAAGALVGSQR